MLGLYVLIKYHIIIIDISNLIIPICFILYNIYPNTIIEINIIKRTRYNNKHTYM